MPALDLSQQVNKILEEYGDDIDAAVQKALKDVGKDGVSVLAEKSDKHVRTGRYAKGWRVDVSKEMFGSFVVTLYNKTDWMLTHLLNNGYYSVRGKRRIKGDGHIDSAESVINEKTIRQVEESLK